jgi:hypothetical protein
VRIAIWPKLVRRPDGKGQSRKYKVNNKTSFREEGCRRSGWMMLAQIGSGGGMFLA